MTLLVPVLSAMVDNAMVSTGFVAKGAGGTLVWTAKSVKVRANIDVVPDRATFLL